MIIRPKINRLDLEKPYNIGTLSGIIIGIGVCKIIVEISRANLNNNSILLGFLILIIGVIMWLINSA